MTQPAGAIDEPPTLPRAQGGPVFGAPCEAQVFALAVRLFDVEARVIFTLE